MKAIFSSKTLVDLQRTTWRYVPKHSTAHYNIKYEKILDSVNTVVEFKMHHIYQADLMISRNIIRTLQGQSLVGPTQHPLYLEH
jgi:hypothetical protein